MNYTFGWDPSKADSNLRKHGDTFALACTVIRDPNAITVFDIDHSETEDRWVTMGIAANGTLLIVNHTFEKVGVDEIIIRVFSARKATSREKSTYQEV